MPLHSVDGGEGKDSSQVWHDLHHISLLVGIYMNISILSRDYHIVEEPGYRL